MTIQTEDSSIIHLLEPLTAAQQRFLQFRITADTDVEGCKLASVQTVSLKRWKAQPLFKSAYVAVMGLSPNKNVSLTGISVVELHQSSLKVLKDFFVMDFRDKDHGIEEAGRARVALAFLGQLQRHSKSLQRMGTALDRHPGAGEQAEKLDDVISLTNEAVHGFSE